MMAGFFFLCWVGTIVIGISAVRHTEASGAKKDGMGRERPRRRSPVKGGLVSLDHSRSSGRELWRPTGGRSGETDGQRFNLVAGEESARRTKREREMVGSSGSSGNLERVGNPITVPRTGWVDGGWRKAAGGGPIEVQKIAKVKR